MSHDWDFLDACDLDFTVDPVSDEDLPYVCLSPEGNPDVLEAYRLLFRSSITTFRAPLGISGQQHWIADKCREWGLEVVEVDGWKSRGGATFNPRGVVCHHTAGPSSGDMPTLRILINGRSDLPGPLCNVGLSRSGKVYVIAAGRANHAGRGGWKGLSGNSSVLGIEAENDGRQPWPAQQLEAYHTLCAALLSGIGEVDADMVCGHKEWAPGRKPDPHSLNMVTFRQDVLTALRQDNEEEELSAYIFFKRNDYGAVFLTTDDFRTFDGIRTVADWNALATAATRAGRKVVGATGDSLLSLTPGQFTEFTDDPNVRTLQRPQVRIDVARQGVLESVVHPEWWKDYPELV